MLGILGTLLFGAVYTGAWMSEEQKEQERYKKAKENGDSIYIDKHNNLRNTSTRKRYSTEDSRNQLKRDAERRIRNKYNIYYKYMLEENAHRKERYMELKKILTFEEWYLKHYGKEWDSNNP